MVALRHDDRVLGHDGRAPAGSGWSHMAGGPGRGASIGPVGPVRVGVGPGVAAAVVVALLLIGSALAGSGAGPGGGAASDGLAQVAGRSAAPVPPGRAGTVHIVRPGESYWSIAVRLGGGRDGDVRPLVDALVAANRARPLQAGDRLVVPGSEG